MAKIFITGEALENLLNSPGFVKSFLLSMVPKENKPKRQLVAEANKDLAARQVDKSYGKLRTGGRREIYQLDSREFLPNRTLAEARLFMDPLNLVESRSAEIIRFPTFVKVADADYGRNVPAYIPNSRIPAVDEKGEPAVDEKGEPAVEKVKWGQWRDNAHEHLADGGFNYIPLNSNTGTVDLAVSLAIRLLDDGYTVVEMNSDTWPTADETP